jgi:zinc protease
MSNTPSKSLPASHNITRVTLDNGVTVLVYENHAAQSVVLAGSLRAGSQYEDSTKNGLASFTTSALMRGTEQRDFDTINSALEDIGADLNISAGVHRTNFFGKSLAEDLPLLVDLLADMLRHPTFPPVQVERLRGEVVTGLQIRQQDSRYRANRAFYENVYPPEHPYHRSTRGTLDTVPMLQIEDMHAYHRRVFGPDGMIVVIVGAVNTADAVAIVRSCLEDWRNDDQPLALALPPVQPPKDTQRVFVPLPGKTQSDIVMGVAGPPRSAPDYHAAQLVNSVLGQFGMMGRIGQSVREDLGLAYYAGSSVEGGLGPGPWSVSAGVNPANVELALDRIIEELRRIVSEPVTGDDLADVQSYYTGHLPLQLESNEGIAGAILNIETFNLGLDYLLTYRDKIYSLTTDDLLRAARRYLHPDTLVISVAGPETN